MAHEKGSAMQAWRGIGGARLWRLWRLEGLFVQLWLHFLILALEQWPWSRVYL